MTSAKTEDERYIASMRAEAKKRRAEAVGTTNELRSWLLQRALFFDRCADERAVENKKHKIDTDDQKD